MTQEADTSRSDPVEPPSGRLGHVIKRVEQALISRKTQVLRAYDLTVPQYTTLLLLSRADGMSAAQLARDTLVTPPTMATVLTNLESKGLVERQPSLLHQKVLVAKATRAGRAAVKKADLAALRVEKQLADAFEPDELALYRDFLERTVKVLDQG